MVIESSRPFRLCATGNDIKGDENVRCADGDE
jgi:hypothetical protein